MSAKKNHTLSGIIVIASCCLLLAGACENDDRIETDTPAKDVLLDFNASITNTTVTGSRAVTAIEGFTGNSYTFGMSITKNKNAIFEGSGDMKAIMSNPPAESGGKWSWFFQKNSDGTQIHPRGPEGRELKVIAYYPAVSGTGAFTNGIPFDFTGVTDLRQTEILYNTNTTYTIPSASSTGAGEVTIPLNFQHAYSWIVINVTKYVETGGDFKLSSVSIDNLSGEWIKNKGAINPETGLVMDGTTPGAIGEARADGQSLSITSPIKYEFLVPSFMDPGVGDGSLVISMMVNGVREVFLLNKEHLNKDGNSYGFRQGYKNTYNLVFNNSSLNLNLLNWTSAEINSNFGEAFPVSKDYMKVNMNPQYPDSYWPSTIPNSKYLSSDNHLFGSYLTTVNYGNNGQYVPVKKITYIPPADIIFNDDENVYMMEKLYPLLEVTLNDISVESVPWEDENGQLVAKELCKKYKGGNHNDWRLPRASELRALFIIIPLNGSKYVNLNFGNKTNQYKFYWTGTEVNENEAWSMYYYNESDNIHRGPMIFPQDKKVRASVRCVRDAL